MTVREQPEFSDAHLVAHAQGEDPHLADWAFTCLVMRHYSRLCAFARARWHHPRYRDPEDFVEEALAAAWRTLRNRGLRDEHAFGAFVMQCVLNAIKTQSRKLKDDPTEAAISLTKLEQALCRDDVADDALGRLDLRAVGASSSGALDDQIALTGSEEFTRECFRQLSPALRNLLCREIADLAHHNQQRHGRRGRQPTPAAIQWDAAWADADPSPELCQRYPALAITWRMEQPARDCLLGRKVFGLGAPEIGACHGLKPKDVHTRTDRARRSFLAEYIRHLHTHARFSVTEIAMELDLKEPTVAFYLELAQERRQPAT